MFNIPPVADIGGPYAVDEGLALTLDASDSYDPDHDITLFEWDLDNDGEYDDVTGVTTTAVFGDDGNYIVRLKVTDSHGESDNDTATAYAKAIKSNQDKMLETYETHEKEILKRFV